MVKLTTLPHKSIIKGLAGALDFYVVHGQAIVRKWPSKFHGPPTVAESCNQQRFKQWQESSKCYSQRVRLLDKGAVYLSDWRWNDYAFKRYLGQAHYAPRAVHFTLPTVPTPCPTEPFQLWQCHDLYFSLTRRTDEDLDPPHGLWRKRYWLDLVAWVDLPGMELEWMVSHRAPRVHRHTKLDRGERVFCGWDAYELPEESPRYGSSGFYGESPFVTHNLTFSTHTSPYLPGLFFGYLRASQYEWPWWPDPHAYSIGPLFYVDTPSYPSMPVGATRFHRLNPIFGTRESDPYDPGWTSEITVMRSVHWPEIDFPPDPFGITLRQGIK